MVATGVTEVNFWSSRIVVENILPLSLSMYHLTGVSGMDSTDLVICY